MWVTRVDYFLQGMTRDEFGLQGINGMTSDD